jgi:YbgC/YbaW family acyl-CoA thioester hydrolase
VPKAGGDVSKYFTKRFHVGWNEINAIGQVGLSNYFQYIVETAWAWGAANGLGIEESEALGLGWVMRETQLSLNRPLRSGEEFDFTIWLADWRRVRGTRCFEIRIADGGDLVADGVQEIVVLDSKTLRPAAAPGQLIENLRMENPRIIPRRPFPKFEVPREMAFMTKRSVEWRDLDWQEHVNNSIYAAFAEEAATQALANLGWAPDQFKAQRSAVANRRVHIQYRSPAAWGEELSVATSLVELKSTGGTWYIDMERQADREPVARCVLEWATIDREAGDERAMPETLLRALQERLAGPSDMRRDSM